MSNDKECFVVSPIGPEGSETRERADKLLQHVIKDAVEELDYETIRADELDEPGQISVQVIQHTVNAELVIADLTGENPNVFYELAIRHASQEPFIQIIEKGHDIPFDIYDQRTVKIDIKDLDSVNDAKNQIKNQIEKMEAGDFEVDSPVSTAMNLQFWEESGDPQQQELADITEVMADMRTEVDKMRADIENIAASGIQSNDLEEIVNIYDRSDDMRRAIRDIKDIIEDEKFEDGKDEKKIEEAVSYLSDSIRMIRKNSYKFLDKYY